MQISLLNTAPSFDRPLEILGACHRRIENYLGILEKVGQTLQRGEFSAAVAQRLREALHYFRTGGEHHTRDEEDSLFPRLLVLRGEDAAAIHEHIRKLAADHRRLSEAHRELDAPAAELLVHAPQVDPALSRRFVEIVFSLRTAYPPHIETEDRILFPFAAAGLAREDLLALGREMAVRRGLEPGTFSPPHPPSEKEFL